jgi:hypothetical protein
MTDLDKLAVALIWQQCFDIVSKYRSSSNYLSLACDDLEKIKPTDALAEVQALRAQIEAADKLAAAIHHYRDFVLDHTGSGEVVPVITEPAQRLAIAISKYEAAKGEKP